MFSEGWDALIRMARDAVQHPQMLEAVMEINRDRRRWVMDRLHERLVAPRRQTSLPARDCVKPETDDIREAPALDLIARIQAEGASVAAYDPAAMANARRATRDVDFASDPYAAVTGSDALVLVTEWNEFKQIDLRRVLGSMRGRVLIDGRNIYDPRITTALGFDYIGMARGCPPHAAVVVEASSGAAD